MIDTQTPVATNFRRLYDALLTGVPFGIFKMAAGWTLANHGAGYLGVLVMAWGGMDILLNVLTMAAPDHVSWCLLSNVGRLVDGEERFLALDTFLSFAIVAAMIGFHLLPELPPALVRAWDLAVIGNVMGVGVDRLYRAHVGSLQTRH